MTACGEKSGEDARLSGGGNAAMAETPAHFDPQSCVECHAAEVESWKNSHHALAHRRLDQSLDAEAFSIGETTDAAGRRFELKNEDGKPTIIDEAMGQEFEVDSAIGVDPLVQYLVPKEGGRFQIHALSYDPHEKEWFDVFGGEERLPGDWGHWNEQGMNWNSNCAFCHLTDYKKNYDIKAHAYASEWKYEGISCAQCHGDLDKHIAAARLGGYVKPTTDDVQSAHTAHMENCASCHARREELTPNEFGPGEDFEDHFRLVLPNQPGAYFADGQALEENYVYASLRLSKMGHKGVTCLDCHDPHTATPKLPYGDNSLCMQCHATGLKEATIINPTEHSRHAEGSAGNRCVECHMPKRVYMDRDWRRDHGFTSPDPHLSMKHGVPNACTGCHQDQTNEWAKEKVDTWFGETDRKTKVHRRADALARYEAGDIEVWEELLALYQDEENPYWRSTYLRMLPIAANEEGVLAAAEKSIEAEEPIERDAAMSIFTARQDKLAEVQAGLEDESRIVRLRAADATLPMWRSNVKAYEEWEAFADANADRPSGALRRAELALLHRDAALAIQLTRQAIGFDLNNPQLKYDGAIMLDRAGDVDGAIKMMTDALAIDKDFAMAYYGLGLLYAEKGDTLASINSLKRAVSKEPTQARWWYNLGVAQAQVGSIEEAKYALNRAMQIEPTNMDFLQFFGQLQGR